MLKNNSGLYTVFKAKDARFDGRFFVGVKSTGIYCRPVCRARLPKEENCTFFGTAAEAEKAGYRPCLLCRPELAPGSSITDIVSVLAQKAAHLLQERCSSGENLNELAEQLGCTGRHLRRVFMKEYNVSPIQYIQTCRLLLAKNLLTDTNLSVTDVVIASGFGSLRRFNDVFKKYYNLSPTDLRKQSVNKNQSKNITISLGYRPPYLWKEILRFFSERSIKGIEKVTGDMYWRTVCIPFKKENICGWVRVSNNSKKNSLDVTVSESLLRVLPQILGKIRNMFDLYCELQVVYDALSSMNNIESNLCRLGTRLPGCFDPFETAVRAILGQQISVKAANTLAERIVNKYGTQIQTEEEGLTHIFPTPGTILNLENIENDFGLLGVVSARSKAIRELAEAFVKKEINLGLCSNPEEEIKKLLSIRGIGNWTAQYTAMRTMSWTNSFLETDAGVKKALKGYSPKELSEISKSWEPWRSYAVVNLWNSLYKEV